MQGFIGSKPFEPGAQPSLQPAGTLASGRLLMFRHPMSEGHLLVDRTFEHMQAYARVRRIRTIRRERKKRRQTLFTPATTAVFAEDGGAHLRAPPPIAPTVPSQPLPSPSPHPTVSGWEVVEARALHILLCTMRILSASLVLIPVAASALFYYAEIIPEARKFAPGHYPLLRDFSPEYIHFLVQYGIPAAVGTIALYRAILQFKSRLEGSWTKFRHPAQSPSESDESSGGPFSQDPEGWGE